MMLDGLEESSSSLSAIGSKRSGASGFRAVLATIGLPTRMERKRRQPFDPVPHAVPGILYDRFRAPARSDCFGRNGRGDKRAFDTAELDGLQASW